MSAEHTKSRRSLACEVELEICGLKSGPVKFPGKDAPKRWCILSRGDGKDSFTLDNYNDVLYATWTYPQTYTDFINDVLPLFTHETKEGFLKGIPYDVEIRISIGDDDQSRSLSTLTSKKPFSFDDYQKVLQALEKEKANLIHATSLTIFFDATFADISYQISDPTNIGRITVAFKDDIWAKAAEILFRSSNPWKKLRFGGHLQKALCWLVNNQIEKELKLITLPKEKAQSQQDLPKS